MSWPGDRFNSRKKIIFQQVYFALELSTHGRDLLLVGFTQELPDDPFGDVPTDVFFVVGLLPCLLYLLGNIKHLEISNIILVDVQDEILFGKIGVTLFPPFGVIKKGSRFTIGSFFMRVISSQHSTEEVIYLTRGVATI